MYIINNFVFGHDLSKDREVKNGLHDMDVYFKKNVDKIDFEVSTPYHGGQCGDVSYSVIFGTIITDDDGNPDYVKGVRNAKAEHYVEAYAKFLTAFKRDLLDNVVAFDDPEYAEYVPKLIEFLDTNEPDFYSVESSS